MKKIFLLLSLLFISSITLIAFERDDKRELTVDDIVKWNRLTRKEISDNGKFISYMKEPWRGTGHAILIDRKGNQLFSADSVKSFYFTSDNGFYIAHRGGKKVESIIVYNLNSGVSEKIDSISKFSLLPKTGALITWSKRDSILYFYDLDGFKRESYNRVGDWQSATNTNNIVAVRGGRVVLILPLEGVVKELSDSINPDKLAISKDGTKVAWLSEGSITLIDNGSSPVVIKSGSETPIPEGWEIPSHSQLYFSERGNKLYFGTAPMARRRDSTIAKDEWPVVQVWHWKEKTQFTAQVIEKGREKRRTYLAVFDIPSSVLSQQGSPYFSRVVTNDKGDGDWVLSMSDTNYRLEQMWTGRSRFDLYITNVVLGRTVHIADSVTGMATLSPKGNWVYWYSYPDSSWYAWSLSTMTGRFITSPSTIPVHDCENDVPDWPSSYGIAGWSKDEQRVYVNDRYDIWQIDLSGKESPVRITKNGKELGVTYRVERVDKESEYIESGEDLLLSVYDNITRESGYAVLAKGFKKEPKIVIKGEYLYSGLIKAKNSSDIIYVKERYNLSPNMHLSDLSFKKETKLTDINPQQSEFLWGRAELVSWTSLDGIKLSGVVYKPENFDPSQKYPLLVNFYEKNSSTLYNYRTPEAHRSTIDYHMYNSNGYVVFNPDIVYRDGYPGESAYNSIMPGIAKLIEEGWVDEKAIGAQGHSWGGYQVAYLAVRTKIFAAIESGAPVVNMFSAYGGIRWGTGLNRSFQYEHQQSRIGATPWESHQRYIENSPIFAMDKVTTPILIMHNDQDGHVPWYQGIEYFGALKRLQKPVWLLNYCGEVHWPQKMHNKMDFQRRMQQFFDHYLRGKPAPKWMSEGVTAIDLDFEMGY